MTIFADAEANSLELNALREIGNQLILGIYCSEILNKLIVLIKRGSISPLLTNTILSMIIKQASKYCHAFTQGGFYYVITRKTRRCRRRFFWYRIFDCQSISG
jgi:hypothetical protein